MSQHEVNFRIENYIIALILAVAMGACAAHFDGKRDAEREAQTERAAKQAKAAAQPDTWARLDRDGREMVAFDRIRK